MSTSKQKKKATENQNAPMSFSEKYKNDFDFVTESKIDKFHAFCTKCRCDFSISHGGSRDIKLHASRDKHKRNVRLEANVNTPSIKSMMSPTVDTKVIKAEMLFVSFLLEHNIPLAAADHAGPLFRAMFPDSAEAAKFAAARTKTTALVQCLGEQCQADLVKSLKNRPFSLATDGGNDKAVEMTLYPLVVTYFCESTQQIETSILSVPALEEAGNGKSISRLLLQELQNLGVDETSFQKNYLAIVTDNASVMVGTKDGTLGQLRQKHENLFSIGCPCHLVNLAAEKAAAALPVRVDELLTDVFYHLEKSKKRKLAFKSFQDECTHKILKHVCTRWLSLGLCLQRLIANWNPLLHFFEEEVNASKPKKSMDARLESYVIPRKRLLGLDDGERAEPPNKVSKNAKLPTTTFNSTSSPKQSTSSGMKGTSAAKQSTSSGMKGTSAAKQSTSSTSKSSATEETREERAYRCLTDTRYLLCANFLKAVVPMFEQTNRLLQSEKPLIHELQPLLLSLLMDIQGNFIRLSVMKVFKRSPLTLNYKERTNQKEDDELFIGSAAEAVVDGLSSQARDELFSSVRDYYVRACDYIVAKFSLRPLDAPGKEAVKHSRGDLFKHAQVADTNRADEHSWTDLKFFISSFPSVVMLKEHEDIGEATDALQRQWHAFQRFEITQCVRDEEREDRKWVVLGDYKQNGEHQFDRLAYFMLSVLSIPHSNAACERLFSQVRKNKTDFRGSLKAETLNAMMVTKGKELLHVEMLCTK